VAGELRQPVWVSGSIGNAPFYDRYLIILGLARSRMGILRAGRL